MGFKKKKRQKKKTAVNFPKKRYKIDIKLKKKKVFFFKHNCVFIFEIEILFAVMQLQFQRWCVFILNIPKKRTWRMLFFSKYTILKFHEQLLFFLLFFERFCGPGGSKRCVLKYVQFSRSFHTIILLPFQRNPRYNAKQEHLLGLFFDKYWLKTYFTLKEMHVWYVL